MYTWGESIVIVIIMWCCHHKSFTGASLYCWMGREYCGFLLCGLLGPTRVVPENCVLSVSLYSVVASSSKECDAQWSMSAGS